MREPPTPNREHHERQKSAKTPETPQPAEPDPSARRYGARIALSLIALLTGGAAFLTLLLAVRAQWAPLAHTDTHLLEQLSSWARADAGRITALKLITLLGNTEIIVATFAGLIATLALRGERRLMWYVISTGAGAGILVPTTKHLIGRERPALALPLSELPASASFPSGHATLSVVALGVITLLLLGHLSSTWRTPLMLSTLTLTLSVGLSRLALGVHYLTDVIAGWTLGLSWLVITTTLFSAWQHERGERSEPLHEGLVEKPPAESPAKT